MMDPAKARELLGGYATGSLSDAEKQALYEAALHDQELFEDLATEDELRELLEQPGVKAELLKELQPREGVWTRFWSWLRTPGGWSAGAALAAAAVLGVTLVWIVMVRSAIDEPVRSLVWGLRWVWWALFIFCLSAELARSIHHLRGMPLTWDGLYTTALFQTSLAVLWSVIALGLMLWGSRRRSRQAWFAGASVLSLTVVKLFLVDLAGVGAVARIVSFIGVGLLILVIAFVAPAPPGKETEKSGDGQ